MSALGETYTPLKSHYKASCQTRMTSDISNVNSDNGFPMSDEGFCMTQMGRYDALLIHLVW